MPSARELLQQADALMRRNRRRGKYRSGNDTTLSGEDATLTGEGPGVPTLTDALAVDAAVPLAPTLMLPDAVGTGEAAADARGTVDAETAAVADADPISLDTLADLPVLTDAVMIADDAELGGLPLRAETLVALVPEEAAAFVAQSDAGPVAEAASSREAEPVVGEPLPSRDQEALSAAEAVPQLPDISAASAGRGVVDDEFILEIPPADDETAAPAPGDSGWGEKADRGEVSAASIATTDGAGPPAPAAAPSIAGASTDWDALADEIRSQVLQRLDLFTDTGLREQLGARLQPIVERASAELVDTINRQVGELIRSYIAEAIEREIDSWRRHHS